MAGGIPGGGVANTDGGMTGGGATAGATCTACCMVGAWGAGGGTSISSSCLRAISMSSLADLAPSWLPVDVGAVATAAWGDPVPAAGLPDAAEAADTAALRRRGSCGRAASSVTSSSLVGVPGDRDPLATASAATGIGIPTSPTSLEVGGGESPGGGGVAPAPPSGSDSGVESAAKCRTMGSSVSAFLAAARGLCVCWGEPTGKVAGAGRDPSTAPTPGVEGAAETAVAGTLTLLSSSCRLEGRLHPPEEPWLRKERPVSVGSELSRKGMPDASAGATTAGGGGGLAGGLPMACSWMACLRCSSIMRFCSSTCSEGEQQQQRPGERHHSPFQKAAGTRRNHTRQEQNKPHHQWKVKGTHRFASFKQ